MSDLSEPNTCPSCGREIPAHAPGGLCPGCVLAGVAEETDGSRQSTRTSARLAMETPSLEDIRAAFTQFEILELIGSGGMGAVFKVRQPKLDRSVALKVLPKSLAEDARFSERFVREARALAKLSHPNIVAIHDFGESEIGGFHYLLMEFVDGANLREAMLAGRFTPEQAFAVVPEICGALQYAHDEGVLHRDIKPENLLLDTKGRVKIVDFGIAKLVGSEAEAPLTGSYSPGTPQYMAPEQIEHPGEVDHRADIYSLGVVFYEMLTGELPIGRFAAPSEKAKVGGQVDDIVFRTLEKEPDRRQQSAGEVKTQVQGIGVEAALDTSVPTAEERTGGVRHESGGGHSLAAGRALLLLGGTLLGFLIVWGAWMGWAHQQRSRDLAQSAGARMEAVQATEKAAILARLAETGSERGLSADAIETLESEAKRVRARADQLQDKWHTRSGFRGIQALTLVVFILSGILLAGVWLYATVQGWSDLQLFRHTSSVGLRGKISAMVAALLLPGLLLSAVIFSILVFPAHGLWTGPAMSLSAVGIVAANAWMIMRTLRWVDETPTAAETLAREKALSAGKNEQQTSKKRRRRWFVMLIIGLLLVPVVLIGSCGFWAGEAYESEAGMAAGEGAVIAQKEAERAGAVAMVETVGEELSALERRIVGKWFYDQEAESAPIEFHADRTWRKEDTESSITMSGTWRAVDDTLEQTITASSLSEDIGYVFTGKIIELIDGTILKIREEGGGDLVLRPIHELSDIEAGILGGWKLEGLEGKNDAGDVVFETLSFWSDRSWALDGNVMDDPLSQWKVLDSTLILSAANQKKKFVLRCDILAGSQQSLTLRRLDTGEELNFLRSSPAPKNPGRAPF